jgi:predicted P-loop ATPase
MTVLESPEGYNKSSSLATLYGEQWFSDQTILGLDDKQLAETVRGRWCIECADLSGMRKAEVERIKAQASRCVDRARPAYGRAVIDVGRSFILYGTTNDREYLRSQTGNRRFFPVSVGRIDVDGLRRDRDMLWGEAMAAHLADEGIMLPEALWADAGAQQEMRTLGDPWEDLVENVSEIAAKYASDPLAIDADELCVIYSDGEQHERVTSAFILTHVLGIPSAQLTADHGKRLGVVMRKQGWTGPQQMKLGGRNARGYERAVTADEPEPAPERELEPWEV